MYFYEELRYNGHRVNQKHSNTVRLFRDYETVKKDYGATDRDSEIPSKEVFDEMLRISKNQIIFGGNYFIEYLHNSPCRIVWDKNNGDNNFADCELARTSFKTAVRKYERTRNGMIQEDMANKEFRYHPTQKPISLFRRLLEKYSERGLTILDPFAGSGTTGVACKELGYNYLMIEREPKYIDIINKRLECITPSLF